MDTGHDERGSETRTRIPLNNRDLTYFVSDLHLGARYHADPREHEQRVCRWLREIAPRCRRLYLLGDVLDYWFEYHNVVPQGFVRFFGTLAELADSGVEITWITGNHDIWIFNYLPREIGFRLIDEPLEETIDGKRFYMAHGDGLGPVPFGERLMRATFRCRLLQKLFASVHPRWTVGLAYGWSASNRTKHSVAPASPAPLLKWLDSNQRPDVDYYIFGHYHLLLDERKGNSRVLILGDWISNMSYAVFDGKELRLETHKI